MTWSTWSARRAGRGSVTSRFLFISTHRAAFGVKRLCRVLAVSRSEFYRTMATR
ncbi:hypothetical protein ACQPWW_16610 [Micromonospora sp. CA-240977]|uniref:hypothetical protein n=1 Tax=Micromonospora sp. CA-240977 TaxID=3239957 RepID=UPI003D8BC1FF